MMSGCMDPITNIGKATVFAITALFHLFRDGKDAASALESVAKVLALLVGGWWTWQIYVRKRVRFPSVKVDHVIKHWEDAGLKFLHVTLRITNTGNVLLPIAEGCTWVQQVTPLSEEIQSAISAGDDPARPKTTEFPWPLIEKRDLNAEDYEIEPGEAEEFHFDFTMNKGVSRVLIYSHIENAKKKKWLSAKKIGWNLSTLYEIHESQGGIRRWLTKNL
jgi:hypothetical protein